jgi:membrane protease subunit HflC
MAQIWQNYRYAVIGALVLLAVLASCIVIVPETHQGVKIRTGKPVDTINRFDPKAPYGQTGAGVWYRIPFVETVQMVDRRILNLDMKGETVLSNDQQRLEVNAYARFRIYDPVQFVESAGSEDRLRNQLEPILTSVLRQELGRRSFASLLTPERGKTMANITKALDRQARRYGAQVYDVRIKRADLPEGTPLDAAYSRMRSDREEEAATIRAGGRRDAQIVRAEAEAEAAKIYANAHGKDPEFYDFFRAMQSYRTTFLTEDERAGESSMILSEDNDYFRQFRSQP